MVSTSDNSHSSSTNAATDPEVAHVVEMPDPQPETDVELQADPAYTPFHRPKELLDRDMNFDDGDALHSRTASATPEPAHQIEMDIPSHPTSTDDMLSDAARSSVPAKATPVPWRKLIALLIVLLNEGLTATLLFPFMGFYVAHLSGVTKEEAGYTSGVLVSVFMLGQFISAKSLGKISDTYGRRPVMLFSLFASGLCILLFGIAPTLPFAIGIRLCHGLVNGNVGIGKAMVAEITDKSNEAKGFAIISVSWGLGCLIGPFFGGVFYDPANAPVLSFLNISPTSYIGSHPALLPCMVAASYSFIAFVVSVLIFPETNTKRRTLDSNPVYHDLKSLATRHRKHPRPVPRLTSLEDAMQHFHHSIHQQPTAGPTPAPASAPKPTAGSKFGYRQAFQLPMMRISIILYVVMCAVEFGWNEVFPLWAISSKNVGGMEWSSALIGALTLMGGVATLLANVFFPTVIRLFGDKLEMWKWSVLVWAVFTAITPLAPLFFSPAVTLVLMFVWQIIRIVACSWSFSSNLLFVSSAAPREHLGVAISIAQSCGCAIRAIVPVLITPLFALSIQHPHPRYLFNYYTSFALLALALFVGFKLGSLVPKSNSNASTAVASDPSPVAIDVEKKEVCSPKTDSVLPIEIA